MIADVIRMIIDLLTGGDPTLNPAHMELAPLSRFLTLIFDLFR